MSQPKVKGKKKQKVKKKKQLNLPNWFTNRKWQAIGIFLIGFLLYANTFTHDFAQDDAIVITDNMFTKDGINGISGIFSKDTFFGFFKTEGKANLVAGGRYRPFTLMMFAIEYQIFGENPAVGHIINALLYGLTGVFLYWLLAQLFSSPKTPLKPYWIPLVGALLFIVHPLHTEAVANIKGRDEIATLLFALMALYFSIRAFKEKKNMLNVLAGILFFLGLLSKENAITFLAIVPLTYHFFTKATIKKIALQSTPFIISAIIFLGIRQSILSGGLTGDPSFELMNNPFLKWTGNGYALMSFGEKMAIIMLTLAIYLKLLFFPFPLTHDYYPRHIDVVTWGDPLVLLSLFIYLGLGIYALIRLPKKDPVSYGILFYLLTLSIVSNIIFPVGTNMSERFLFMPSVGFSIVIAVLTSRLAKIERITQFKQITPYLAGFGVIALAFSILTIVRNPAWKDNYTLFLTDIYKSPNSAKLRNAVGGELTAQALKQDEVTKNEMLREAVGHLQEAIKIHPTYKNAYLLLGNANSLLKNYQEAIGHYDQALNIDPNYQEAINNKAITYRNLGRFYGEEQNNLNASIQNLELAYQLNPSDYETLRLLGVANGILGNQTKAIDYFRKALTLEPQNADAMYNLGTAYHASGDTAKGNEYHQKALAIDPNAGKPK